MQTITLCTDAGHKNLYKQSCAVWAAYIRTPQQTIKVSGIIKQQVKGSSHAELYALANALHVIGKEVDLSKYKLIVYSDNMYALRNHLDGTIYRAKSDALKVYTQYIKPHIMKAKEYEARHVKAHLPQSEWSDTSARHFMQDWCDKEVHRIMKIAQKEIINKNKSEKIACVLDKKRA